VKFERRKIMQRIAITANDGKIFYGTVYEDVLKEVNAHEADIELKNKVELERRKKLEEEHKVKEEKIKTIIASINSKNKEIEELIKEYKSIVGNDYYFIDMTRSIDDLFFPITKILFDL
jgi:ABC-type multidrug transport system ATPase subunit